MQSFDHSVSLWVIGCGGLMTNAPELEKLNPDVREELGSAVSRDNFWNAMGGDPAMRKRINNRVGSNVTDWNGHGPSRETVHDR